jgi:hypothetical protein
MIVERALLFTFDLTLKGLELTGKTARAIHGRIPAHLRGLGDEVAGMVADTAFGKPDMTDLTQPRTAQPSIQYHRTSPVDHAERGF